MSSSGQSVTDRLNAAKHSLTGQGLAKAVCKSTTEEVSGPKRKHLDYLLQCTHETNVSVPQMADLLIQRTQTANWVVVFKSLVTVHNVMNYGSERYMQYMASNTVFSNLDSFNDRSTPQGYDMSTYIRKYAKYINEKAVAYRLMAFDFCKVKRGKEDGLLRTMAPEKLLKALPVLQAQIDALLEFDPSLNELNNGVINAAFLLLFKDLIRLFACYNDGIINLLEKFFEMNRKQCKEALDIYKKFLVRMDQTGEFLKVAENVGIDKGDIPDLTKAPASLLEALEAHLKSLEGKKASKLQTTAQKAGGTGLSEEEKKKILAEEEKELQRMKERKEKAQSHSAQMESASQVPANPTTQVIAPQPAAPAPSASDDLLALDVNPFQAKANNVLSVANNANQQWSQSPLDPMSLSPAPAQPTPGAFTSETGFASVFGSTQPSPMPGMLLQPSTAPALTSQQQSQADLLDLDLGAPVSESPAEPNAAAVDENSASGAADSAEETTPPAATAAEADVVDEEAEAAVEAMPDILSSNDNLLCVSIGGQSITINTKPASLTASANVSVDSTPHTSPQPAHKSPPQETSADEKEANPEEAVASDNVAVMDLLADFSAPVEAPAAAATGLNSDIMDLLGGLEVVEPAPLTLPGSIDVVTAECSLPQPAVMLLPTSERSITPSPSIVNPNQAVEKEKASTPLLGEEVNGESEVQLSSEANIMLPDVTATASPAPSPKPTPTKAAKPAPVPSNPLEAAMFKQLFPEQPKVAAKKSLLEMQAESGSKSASVSPAMTRRDSHTDGESGQLLMPQKNENQLTADSKLVKKDLDSSLASLTESKLVMTPGSMNKGNHQWGPQQPKKMTGGQNFAQTGQPAAAGASTWMPQQPMMAQPMVQGQPPAAFNMQPAQQYFVNPAAPQLFPTNYAANPYATNMQMAPPTYQPRPQQPMAQQQPMMQPMQPQSTNNPDLFGL